MDPQVNKTRMVAALGRPFGLGMLYDCRQDLLIPGMTLWGRDELENHIRVRPKAYNDFQIMASESVSDKISALHVEASLTASFFSGLVEVGGSAKYLNDEKTSKNQARVTLKYEATTKFQELSMQHLGKVNYPYIFEQGIATHVVTGILYGAQAFLVFDSDVSENENLQDIEGSLHVMIKKIPSIVIEGSGAVKLSDEDTETVKKFTCKFHGDFLLDKTPTTFQDAVEVYQNLPTLLGEDGEKAKPVKVWLFPLTNLDSKAAKLVREISASFVEDAQNVLEDLNEVDIRCNDALKTLARRFSAIGKKLENFKEMCGEFKVEFQRNLAKILPTIRGGGKEEAELGEILEKRMASPFNNTSLNQWMDCKEREVNTVTFFSSLMKNTQTVSSQVDLYKEVLSVEHAACFIFTSLESDEPYLAALAKYLKATDQDDPTDTNTQDVEKEQWFTSKEVMDDMRKKEKLFSDFAEANKDNKNIKFLTAGLKDEKHKGSTIYLYKDGFTVSEDFEPPSKPESLTVGDINHSSVTLKISPPRFGADSITSYSVEFCIRGEDAWKQTAPTSGDVTVSDLKPNTEYVFRCRAVTSLGVGPASDPIDPIKTLPCSPPLQLHAEKDVCELSVSWKQPAEIGQGVQIISFIVEYAVKEQDLHWNQIKSSAQNVTISMLQPDTEYAVRVTCDCGEAGRSKASVASVWRTPDTYLLLLQEILHDFPALEGKLTDALQSTTVRNFPQIGVQLETFKSLCMDFRRLILDELKTILRYSKTPILRREEKELVITKISERRKLTPFNERALGQWVQMKTSETNTIQTMTDAMQNTEIIQSQYAFEEKIRSAEHVVSFVFTSFGDAQDLSALSDFIDRKYGPTPRRLDPSVRGFLSESTSQLGGLVSTSFGDAQDLSALSDFIVRKDEARPHISLSQVGKRAQLFSDFAEANKDNKNIKFLTVGLTDEKHKGSTIHLYKNGFTVSEDFEPPSQPESVTAANSSHSSVTLKISPPRFGADSITSYSVEFCVKGEDAWKQTTAPTSGDVTVSDLKPNTEYVFRCRAVTSAGVGPAREINHVMG